MGRESRPNRSKVAAMTDKAEGKPAPVTIKKYANRRLYNTASSSYVTLDHLAQMVKEGTDFVVYDAKTGEDITRSVLTQIIVEEESKGQNLLPIGFLRQLISLYGDSMQWMVPRYLEHSMQAFSRNQEQMREYFQNTLGGMFPFAPLEEVGKQNLAMLERAMRMFAPFTPGESKAEDAGAPQPQPPSQPQQPGRAATDNEKALEELQRKFEELQRQIASLPKGK
jgi:polyhydroxyalkanoate synthesis repressor PhaR